MKNHNLLSLFSFLSVVLLSGCSPRVTTDIVQTMPPQPLDSVQVYHAGEPMPSKVIQIGKVAVVDRGLTTHCKYDEVLHLARLKTAESGGNGLLITRHQSPSMKSSCHQVWGDMLYVSGERSLLPVDSSAFADKPFGTQIQRRPRQKLPRNVLGVGVGPSRVMSKVYGVDGNVVHSKGGMQFWADYAHIWQSGLGVGLDFAYNHTTYGGLTRVNMYYVGPSVGYHYVTTQRWHWSCSIGVGYASLNEMDVMKQHGVGTMSKLGVAYVLNDHVGLGLQINSLSRSFSNPGVSLDDDERYGIATLDAALSLSFYF